MPAANPSVLLVPRTKVPAWKGEEPMRVPAYNYLPLLDALHREDAFAKDWCVQPVVLYDVRNGERTLREYGPRLGAAALARIANDPHIEADLTAALIDLDFGDHEEPPEGWAEQVSARIKWPHGWYRSPNGMRLVFIPKQPVPVLKGNAYLSELVRELEAMGVPDLDPTTNQALRLQRSMHALGRDLPYNLEGLAPLTWHPDEQQLSDAPKLNIKHWPERAVQPRRVDDPTNRQVRIIKDTRLRQQILDGRLPARTGERHKTLLEVAMRLVGEVEINDPDTIFQWLFKSADNLFKYDANPRRWEDELWNICCWAIAAVKSAQDEARETQESALQEAAKHQGIHPDEMRRRVIIAGDDAYFVWNEAELRYAGPYGNKDHILMALRENAPSLSAGVGLRDDFSMILSWYGSHMSELAYSYNPKDCGFERGVLTCQAAPLREVEPNFHAGVDCWLRAFGGDREDRWMDWLASLPDLSKPQCAVYILGDQGIGKDLLGTAIARLWTHNGRFVEYDEVERFPLALKSTPFVWANESIQERSSSMFRRLVGSSSREVDVKHHPKFSLRGCPILLISANNPDALQIDENVTNRDLDAIRLRLGFLDAESRPRRVLHELLRQYNEGRDEPASMRDMTSEWLEQDTIVAHLRWLHENRKVVPDHRFVIEGWDSILTRSLQTARGDTATILTVIIRAIQTGSLGNAVVVRGGEQQDIGIHAIELANIWRDAIGNHTDRVPPLAARRAVVKELADRRRAEFRHNGAKRYTRMTWDSLLEHAENLGDVDIRGLREALVKLTTSPTIPAGEDSILAP